MVMDHHRFLVHKLLATKDLQMFKEP
jgi:hypothetical protein